MFMLRILQQSQWWEMVVAAFPQRLWETGSKLLWCPFHLKNWNVLEIWSWEVVVGVLPLRKDIFFKHLHLTCMLLFLWEVDFAQLKNVTFVLLLSAFSKVLCFGTWFICFSWFCVDLSYCQSTSASKIRTILFQQHKWKTINLLLLLNKIRLLSLLPRFWSS